jgi:hypothetical protein
MIPTSSLPKLPPVITLPKLPPQPPMPVSQGPLGLRRMAVTEINWDFSKQDLREMVLRGVHLARPYQFSEIRAKTSPDGKIELTISPDPTSFGGSRKLSTADLRDLANNLRSLPEDHPARNTFAFGSFLHQIDRAIAQAKPPPCSRFTDGFEG